MTMHIKMALRLMKREGHASESYFELLCKVIANMQLMKWKALNPEVDIRTFLLYIKFRKEK